MATDAVVRLKLPRGFVALVDAADFERPTTVGFADGAVWEGRICDRAWQPNEKPHTTYVVCLWQKAGKVRELRLHRAVMSAAAGIEVDHRNHDGLDNRRENLRLATSTENSRNKRPLKGRQYKGVSYHKASGRYEAFIRCRPHKYHLGLHDTPELAALAYNAKAAELFGPFARLNEVPA